MLKITNLGYRIDGRPLFDAASMALPRGRRAALIGRNGSGKSTLLALIAGDLQPDAGSLELRSDARVALVAQTAPSGQTSVHDTVLAADMERTRLLTEADKIETDDGSPLRIAEIHERLADIDAHSAPARAGAILHGLGFDAEAQARPLDEFSGGWRMRVALAAALFAEPDLLLLDEPTNHLDLEASLWLVQYLARWRHTLLVVSHDRGLINRVANHTIHLHQGRLVGYRGGFDAFERARREQIALESSSRKKLSAQRRHMQAYIDRFRYKATKARQAQSRLKALERLGEPPPPVADQSVEFHFPEPTPLSPPLIALDRTSAGYEPTKAVLSGLNLRIDMDDRIALLGANGNGKTTLLRLLARHLSPLAGELTAARKLKVGYFAQDQADALDPTQSALGHVAELMPNADETRRRAHLGRFGLSGPLAEQTSASLSGGERVRLVLALVCCDAPHILLLDEPTNHLDLDAREALIEAINEYTGAIVLVTHDRQLIELCADRLWLVADGTCRQFDGDIDAYQSQLLASRNSGANGKQNTDKPKTSSKPERRRKAAAQRAETAALRKAAREAENRVAKLTKENDDLAAKLSDPALYEGPREEFADLTRRKRQAEKSLAEAETAWLEAAAAMEHRSAGNADT